MKRVFKLHWVWEGDQQEQWLAEMAEQGWHLAKANALCIYTFRAGPPAAVAYRLDYRRVAGPESDYRQLFEDAGWEHVLKCNGWHFWRKSVAEGRLAEIFTDRDSKIQRLERIARFLGIAGFMIPVYLGLCTWGLSVGDTSASWTEIGGRMLLLGGLPAFALLGFALLRIHGRIRALKGPL